MRDEPEVPLQRSGIWTPTIGRCFPGQRTTEKWIDFFCVLFLTFALFSLSGPTTNASSVLVSGEHFHIG